MKNNVWKSVSKAIIKFNMNTHEEWLNKLNNSRNRIFKLVKTLRIVKNLNLEDALEELMTNFIQYEGKRKN